MRKAINFLLTVHEEKEEVLLRCDGVGLRQEEVYSYFEHIPVLENGKGLLANVGGTEVALQYVSTNFVQFIDYLVFADAIFFLIRVVA